MYNRIIIIVTIILGVLLLISLIVYLAYYVSAAHQQTVSISLPFQETYRYHNEDIQQLDEIKITVTGKLKNNIISDSNLLREKLLATIITPYTGAILLHEAETFIIDDRSLKRIQLTKQATLENLSRIFFNKLAPLMPEIGARLTAVKLLSNGVKVTHSQYKMNNYTI